MKLLLIFFSIPPIMRQKNPCWISMQPISSSHSSHHTFHPKKTTRFAFCCCFQQNAQSVVPYVDKKRVFTILNYIPEEYYYEELYQEVSSLCSYFEDYPLPSLVWTIKNTANLRSISCLFYKIEYEGNIRFLDWQRSFVNECWRKLKRRLICHYLYPTH